MSQFIQEVNDKVANLPIQNLLMIIIQDSPSCSGPENSLTKLLDNILALENGTIEGCKFLQPGFIMSKLIQYKNKKNESVLNLLQRINPNRLTNSKLQSKWNNKWKKITEIGENWLNSQTATTLLNQENLLQIERKKLTDSIPMLLSQDVDTMNTLYHDALIKLIEMKLNSEEKESICLEIESYNFYIPQWDILSVVKLIEIENLKQETILTLIQKLPQDNRYISKWTRNWTAIMKAYISLSDKLRERNYRTI